LSGPVCVVVLLPRFSSRVLEVTSATSNQMFDCLLLFGSLFLPYTL
jgi:hypothetical protein